MTSHICASVLRHMSCVVSLLFSGIFVDKVLQVSSVFVAPVSLFCSFLGAEFGSIPDRRRSQSPSRPSVLKRCIQIPTQSGHCIRHVAASFILKPSLHTMFTARIRALTLGSFSFLYAFFRSSLSCLSVSIKNNF